MLPAGRRSRRQDAAGPAAWKVALRKARWVACVTVSTTPERSALGFRDHLGAYWRELAAAVIVRGPRVFTLPRALLRADAHDFHPAARHVQPAAYASPPPPL